ncbi:hypothetical protein C7212DRAFT_347343 [Tuber magnatum]|uniref:Uncharacterized protein n=1 Tax=Tuber magnatum TaxID=42249 RepID=A0A317SI01_9PEZI|nr:hypothetical protein C7212DRAFT_347343 [Tuber magnatum]
MFLLTYMLLSCLYDYVKIAIRRYLIYAMVPRWLGGLNHPSRLQAIAILCGMAANWLCIVITADGVCDIRSHTGQLATIHMILLCLGSRMSILTSYTYIFSYRQQIAHNWLGWITISNDVVNSIIGLGIERRLEPDGVGISQLVVSRQYPYMAVSLGACLQRPLWYHLYAVPFRLGPLYVGIAIGLLAVGYLSRFGHIWCRSGGMGPNARCLSVRPLVDAIQFCAGQHIYLRCMLHALVERPFGIEHDLGSYGTVLMLTSGVGIAAQVQFIRRLLEGRGMSMAWTPCIVIYWRRNNEGEAQRSPYILGGRSNSPEHTRNG